MIRMVSSILRQSCHCSLIRASRRLLMSRQSLQKLLQKHEPQLKHGRCWGSNMTDATFDLGTNAQVPISAIDTDASGSVVTGAKTVFSVPDSTVVTLQDQADGTTVAVRVANTSGSVVVTGTVTNADGTTATGTLTLSLGAQVPPVTDVTSVELVPGTPS